MVVNSRCVELPSKMPDVQTRFSLLEQTAAGHQMITEADQEQLAGSCHWGRQHIERQCDHLVGDSLLSGQLLAVDIDPVISHLCNTSLQSCHLPVAQKLAIIRPRLKKPTLNTSKPESYWLITNLSFLSKLLEWVVASRYTAHAEEHKLFPVRQSAYWRHHSTENVVVSVLNDVIRAADDGKVTCLVLVDTVDRSILLDVLHRWFLVEEPAFKWFHSICSIQLFCTAHGWALSQHMHRHTNTQPHCVWAKTVTTAQVLTFQKPTGYINCPRISSDVSIIPSIVHPCFCSFDIAAAVTWSRVWLDSISESKTWYLYTCRHQQAIVCTALKSTSLVQYLSGICDPS